MNEKFFELSKEKQDRMINGAVRVFAENGYKHASTDDMVKVAGVSKGLWFHYFGNKLGLYEFMCEYSVRYFCMELSTAVDSKQKDYYTVLMQMIGAVDRVSRAYPYLPLFLYQLSIENDLDAATVTVLGREKIHSKLNSIMKNVELGQELERKDKECLHRMIVYTLQGILLETYHASDLQMERMIKDMKEHVKKFQEYTASYQTTANTMEEFAS